MTLEPINIVCPHCGNVGYMRHLVGKGVGRLDIKCINCNSYFNSDELFSKLKYEAIQKKSVAMPHNIFKPITNEGRLNAMTTEEKAEFLATTQMNILLLAFKPFGIKPDIDKDMVVAEWLDWLKQEVDE